MTPIPSPAYAPSPIDSEAIERLFTYHPVIENQAERYAAIRAKAKELAFYMANYCPPSRELASAIAELQIAVMLANAAIACNESAG